MIFFGLHNVLYALFLPRDELRNKYILQNKIYATTSWTRWCIPIVPDSQEAQKGESLKPRSLRPA